MEAPISKSNRKTWSTFAQLIVVRGEISTIDEAVVARQHFYEGPGALSREERDPQYPLKKNLRQVIIKVRAVLEENDPNSCYWHKEIDEESGECNFFFFLYYVYMQPVGLCWRMQLSPYSTAKLAHHLSLRAQRLDCPPCEKNYPSKDLSILRTAAV